MPSVTTFRWGGLKRRRRPNAWVWLTVLACAVPATGLCQNQPAPPQTEELLLELAKAGLSTNRTNASVTNPPVIRVTRRNRRPVAAGVMVKFTFLDSSSGPSATFGVNGPSSMEFPTGLNGEVTPHPIVTNGTRGNYEMTVRVDYIDTLGIHYVSAPLTVAMSNGPWVTPPTPHHVLLKVLIFSAVPAIALPIVVVKANSPPKATINFGAARVGAP